MAALTLQRQAELWNYTSRSYQRAVQRRQTNNGIAVHANSTQYNIQWDSAEVVCQEIHWYKMKVQEVLWIRRTENTMNLDQGLQLNPIWSTLLWH